MTRIIFIFSLMLLSHVVLALMESCRKKWFKKRHEKQTAETDLLKWVLLKKRLSFRHLSMEGAICYHTIIIYAILILIAIVLFLFEHHILCALIGLLSVEHFFTLNRLYKKMKYRRLETDNSFENIESKVNAWVETLTSEKDRKVSWKKVSPSENDLRIAIETAAPQEHPFIIHVVKNNHEILFNLVGIGEEYNHSIDKDNPFSFLPDFLKTDYSTNYYTHCLHLDHLESALRTKEDSTTEK